MANCHMTVLKNELIIEEIKTGSSHQTFMFTSRDITIEYYAVGEDTNMYQ